MLRKLIKSLKIKLFPNKFLIKYIEKHPFKNTINSDNSILVDTTVAKASYVLGNLIVAYYLSIFKKCKIVILHSSPVDIKYLKLIKSFGNPVLIYSDIRYLRRLKSSYWVDKIEDYPLTLKQLEDFTYEDVPLGDLIYDTYIRITANTTISELEEVRYYLKEAIFYYKYYSECIQKYNIKYFVTGHIVYNRLGVMTRTLIKSGGEVFSKKYGAGPFTIRHYKMLSEIKKYEFKFEKKEFESYKAKHNDNAHRRGKKYIIDRFKANATKEDLNVIEAFHPDKLMMSKSELCEKVNFDKEKPIVVIMSHVMGDAPHSNSWMIYTDYVHWFKNILRMISEIKDVNWLIKPHPANKFYSKSDEVLTYSEEYLSKANIALCPEELNTASIGNIVSAVVTCNGTSGLEFSALGIPCVLAGESPYSELGFTHEPHTETELEQMLSKISSIERLKENQIKDALIFCTLHYLDSRIESSFIPNVADAFWIEYDENKFWLDSINCLGESKIENDPVFIHFKYQLENENPHMIKDN